MSLQNWNTVICICFFLPITWSLCARQKGMNGGGGQSYTPQPHYPQKKSGTH
jgi:hypothetical protein